MRVFGMYRNDKLFYYPRSQHPHARSLQRAQIHGMASRSQHAVAENIRLVQDPYSSLDTVDFQLREFGRAA